MMVVGMEVVWVISRSLCLHVINILPVTKFKWQGYTGIFVSICFHVHLALSGRSLIIFRATQPFVVTGLGVVMRCMIH